MIYNPDKKEIILNRELGSLDRFVIRFCNLLDEYVLVSGYVSILFGRSRGTEDVDLLIPPMNCDKFKKLWYRIHENGFECINTANPKEAFDILKEHNVRFSKKDEPKPNMEFKIIKTDLDRYSYENKIKVILKKGGLFISPIEMQIAYKMFLAADGTDKELMSDKDIEDARYLYKIFEEKINKEEFLVLINKLNVKKRLKWLK